MSAPSSLATRVLAGGSLRAPSSWSIPGALAFMAILAVGAGAVLGQALPALPEKASFVAPSASVEIRTMSVYSDSYIGKKMANGAPYDPHDLTVASNDWPLGTELLLVRHGRSVAVTVTDRMHKKFSGIRVDASKAVWNILTSSAKPGLRKVEVQK